MNDQAVSFAVSWLKERGYFDDMSGTFVLELFETYVGQSHDEETIRDVPEIFCELLIDLIKDGYLDD